VVNRNAALGHHLFKIPQAQTIGQVPSDAEQDDGFIELPALEHCVLAHCGLDAVAETLKQKFATHPETLHRLDEQIAGLDREVAQRAKEDETARRLMTIPGVGLVTAVALAALAPPADTFKRGRDFAAWVGLTPLQHSTGGKQKLGATSKMGERTLRRLLIIGASAVVSWVARNGAPAGSWMARMVARKPPMLVRVALANKMARIVWALMARGGVYQAPVAMV
jgi:transposase